MEPEPWPQTSGKTNLERVPAARSRRYWALDAKVGRGADANPDWGPDANLEGALDANPAAGCESGPRLDANPGVRMRIRV